MNDIFFTADLHISHGNIIKYSNRPFLSKEEQELYNNGINFRPSRESIEYHDDTIIGNINKIVGKHDVLYLLGDFCFPSTYDVAKRYRDRINCKNIHFIFGNHDRKKNIYSLFSSANDLSHIKIDNQSIVLCHYAMAIWNKSHYGTYHLYGHSHSSAESFMDEKFPNRKSMDVGIDNINKIYGQYRPISFDEVKTIMDSKSGFCFDHHTPDI